RRSPVANLPVLPLAPRICLPPQTRPDAGRACLLSAARSRPGIVLFHARPLAVVARPRVGGLRAAQPTPGTDGAVLRRGRPGDCCLELAGFHGPTLRVDAVGRSTPEERGAAWTDRDHRGWCRSAGAGLARLAPSRDGEPAHWAPHASCRLGRAGRSVTPPGGRATDSAGRAESPEGVGPGVQPHADYR